MAVEEGDVDAAAFIGVVKVDDVGFVEEIGIEDDRAVLSVRDGDGFGSALFEKFLNFVPVLVVIVFGKVPVVWRFFVPHDQAAIGGVAVCFIGCNPKIHIHRCRIGMHVESLQGTIVLEGPGLHKLMLLKDTGKPTTQFFGDLQQERAGKPIGQKGADIAV